MRAPVDLDELVREAVAAADDGAACDGQVAVEPGVPAGGHGGHGTDTPAVRPDACVRR